LKSQNNKRALIVGISGQDGSYLAKYLLDMGYEVIGSSRDHQINSFINLKKLNIINNVKLTTLVPENYDSVVKGLTENNPSLVFNLSGQTSVGISFSIPVETINSIYIGTMNFLEAIRKNKPSVKYFNAGSSECYGDIGNTIADERTRFSPQSPYAIAKTSAHYLVKQYRQSYGLYACTGILFNHESNLRSSNFVTMKIILAAKKIHSHNDGILNLGNLDIYRDWGWAPEYVVAMWRIMQHEIPDDFIIATGKTTSLKTFVEKAFSYYSLNWVNYVVEDKRLFRPTDIKYISGDPSKINKNLGWKSTFSIDEIINALSIGVESA
jgi:GDPmannose 4,6-dehydratase